LGTYTGKCVRYTGTRDASDVKLGRASREKIKGYYFDLTLVDLVLMHLVYVL